jgi:hypothetical protein
VWERRSHMFGFTYDKADWLLGLLLVVAMVAAILS